MAEQDWLAHSPAPLASAYDSVTTVPSWVPPAYELRPLTLGELLDRTFALYRSRFWMFAGIASIAAVVELAAGGTGRVAVHHYSSDPATVYAAGLGVTYVAAFLYFFVYCVTQAATCFALAEVYLGRPATIASSFRAVRGKWYAWIGIGWWQALSAGWPLMAVFVPFVALSAFKNRLGTAGSVVLAVVALLGFLPALVYGVIAYIRNSLAIPAKVVEGQTVRQSMRRSKTLAAGTKGRIAVLGLIVFALQMVAGMMSLPFAVMTAGFKTGTHVFAEMAVLMITFLAHTVVTPIVSIGLCLIYFDQRVRREAFDIEVLLGPGPDPVATSGEMRADAPLV